MENQKPPNVKLAVLFAVAGVLISETMLWAVVDYSKVSYWGHWGLSLIVGICAGIGAYIGRKI